MCVCLRVVSVCARARAGVFAHTCGLYIYIPAKQHYNTMCGKYGQRKTSTIRAHAVLYIERDLIYMKLYTQKLTSKLYEKELILCCVLSL